MKLAIVLSVLCIYQVNGQATSPAIGNGFVDPNGFNNLINLINSILSNLLNNRRPIVSETSQTQPAPQFPWNIFNPFQQPTRPPPPHPLNPPHSSAFNPPVAPVQSSQSYPNVRQRPNSKHMRNPAENSEYKSQPIAQKNENTSKKGSEEENEASTEQISIESKDMN